MPAEEAPCVELGSVPPTPSVGPSPSPSEVSSASSPEPTAIQASPLFRALAMPPPEPEQPPGQEDLERRLPGYRRIVIPRDLTLIELLKQDSGVTSDEEVLHIREAKLRVVADRVGLRRLHVLVPRLKSLTLDGSALSSLRDLGIGLVHLKILSVNRCGLRCLDGVWGLGALREFYAAGNKLQDMQPLGALQKLNTLDLAGNPIEDTSRLWTLGVCGSLRRLTLKDTPVSDEPDYQTRVASALPMLIILDGRLLHADLDEENDDITEHESSDSEVEDIGEILPLHLPPAEPVPVAGPAFDTESISEDRELAKGDGDSLKLDSFDATTPKSGVKRRPATTESAGLRPVRPNVPPRPRTAHARPTYDPPSKLQVLNTLMDEEWRCSGSKLTSHAAVCGNLAQALRRPASARTRYRPEMGKEMVEQTMAEVSRAVAAEIPRAPSFEDWAKFREETGIDIEIDFNERPKGADALSAIERLERIERETFERFQQNDVGNDGAKSSSPPTTIGCAMTYLSDFETWKQIDLNIAEPRGDIDSLFKNIDSTLAE